MTAKKSEVATGPLRHDAAFTFANALILLQELLLSRVERATPLLSDLIDSFFRLHCGISAKPKIKKTKYMRRS
jgi:hypothetical protein